MRSHQLAKLLGAYGVKSQSLREGEVVFRGYPRDRLDDAIERYGAHTQILSGDFAHYSVTRVEEPGEIALFETVTEEARNTSENAGNPNKSRGCNVVTPKRLREGASEEIGANALIGFSGDQSSCRPKALTTPVEVAALGLDLDTPSRKLVRTIL
jgi:hypothetical protein